jgi:acetyltransferase-like isoleucine patch superfamily enzyme
MTIGSALKRILRHPVWSYRSGMRYVRGAWYKLKFKLLRRRVIIGKRFRVEGRLDIRGPGTVIFGDDCGVVSTRYQVTTPWTHTREAVIRLGDHVLLTGTRFGCVARIEVADYAGLSDARIMDSDFHAIETKDGHRSATHGRTKPVIIGRNVWLGAGSMVLKGVTIGENAVVGAGSVVATNVPANAIVFGNPARVIWRVRAKAAAPATAPTTAQRESVQEAEALLTPETVG